MFDSFRKVAKSGAFLKLRRNSACTAVWTVILITTGVSDAQDPPKPREFPPLDMARTGAEWDVLIRKQFGVTIGGLSIGTTKVAGPSDRRDFWSVLEHYASATQQRLDITPERIDLRPAVPAASGVASSIHGPFRTAVRDIEIRRGFGLTKPTYTVGLSLAWQPGQVVYRADSGAKNLTITDDQGNNYPDSSGKSRQPTAGLLAEVTVLPDGVPRSARTINLKGNIRVTMADELLTFDFPADVSAAEPALKKNVSVRYRGKAVAGDWVVTIDLKYPPGGPVWESFESYWIGRNEITLVDPNGKSHPTAGVEVDESSARYVFKGLANRVAKGWSVTYRTPGPMREVDVPFQLKNIPLP